MTKKITFVTILVLVASFFSFPAANKEKEELYLKAITEKDLNTKIGLLKEYEQKYGQIKEDKTLKFIYQALADTSYRLKNYDETINYGEIALGYEDMDQSIKLNTLLFIANSFLILKKDFDKAYSNAEKMIELCDKFASQMENSGQDKAKVEQMVNVNKTAFIAPAYSIQAWALYSKDKDNPESVKLAAQKFLKAYEIDKAERTANMIFSLSVNLSQKNLLQDAIDNVEKIYNRENNPKIFIESSFLGQMYLRLKEKEKAIHYMELAYKIKPQADAAMSIGRMVNKTDPEKGIRYFSDAYILNGEDVHSDAYKYLQQLYFMVVAKDKSNDEKEKGFQQILDDAKARVGNVTKEETNN